MQGLAWGEVMGPGVLVAQGRPYHSGDRHLEAPAGPQGSAAQGKCQGVSTR